MPASFQVRQINALRHALDDLADAEELDEVSHAQLRQLYDDLVHQIDWLRLGRDEYIEILRSKGIVDGSPDQ